MCDKELLKSHATKMTRIILQRSEEVFPALKEGLRCTVSLPDLQRSCNETGVTCVDAYDISVKREDTDIDCQEEEIPISISFPTITCQQDEHILNEHQLLRDVDHPDPSGMGSFHHTI